MALNVHLADEFDEAAVAELQRQLEADIQLTIGSTLPLETHILIDGRPSREQLTHCPGLQAVIVPWAGIPETTQHLLREFPQITLHNLHHNVAATAEMAVALLLATAKFIVPFDRKLRANDWTPRYGPVRSIGFYSINSIL